MSGRCIRTCFYGLPCQYYTQTINSGNTAVVTWTAPSASDACAPINLTSNYVSGATFPVGNTQVVYQASDRKGNKTTCAFNVTVLTPCLNDNVGAGYKWLPHWHYRSHYRNHRSGRNLVGTGSYRQLRVSHRLLPLTHRELCFH